MNIMFNSKFKSIEIFQNTNLDDLQIAFAFNYFLPTFRFSEY